MCVRALTRHKGARRFMVLLVLTVLPCSSATDFESALELEPSIARSWPDTEVLWCAARVYVVTMAGATIVCLAGWLSSQEGRRWLSFHWLACVHAVTVALGWAHRSQSCSPATSKRLQPLPCMGYANVSLSRAVPLVVACNGVASHPPRPADVVASHGGLSLHLSSRSATGYEGVTFIPSRSLTPYRVKADGSVLGYFSSSVEAAFQFAQHRESCLHSGRVQPEALPLASTFALPSGEMINLHMSTRSPTGYCGVALQSTYNRAKPYLARLGPTAADVLGYYASAVEAAAAVACALRACDTFVSDAIDGCAGSPLPPELATVPYQSQPAIAVPTSASEPSPVQAVSLAASTASAFDDLDIDAMLASLCGSSAASHSSNLTDPGLST